MESGDRQAVISTVLARIVGTVRGFVDTGTALCLAAFYLPSVGTILASRREALNALVIVLDEFLGPEAHSQPLSLPMREIREGCRAFSDAMCILERFREVGSEETRRACESLENAYSQVVANVRKLADLLAVSVPSAVVAAWREEYYQKILKGLAGVLEYEREHPDPEGLFGNQLKDPSCKFERPDS